MAEDDVGRGDVEAIVLVVEGDAIDGVGEEGEGGEVVGEVGERGEGERRERELGGGGGAGVEFHVGQWREIRKPPPERSLRVKEEVEAHPWLCNYHVLLMKQFHLVVNVDIGPPSNWVAAIPESPISVPELAFGSTSVIEFNRVRRGLAQKSQRTLHLRYNDIQTGSWLN